MAEIGNVTVRVDSVITDEHYRVTMGAVMAANECMDLLAAENRKLRELVDYMTPIAWYAASEQERDRMRELGIEVDG